MMLCLAVVVVVMSCGRDRQSTAVAAPPLATAIVITESTPGYPGAIVVGAPAQELVIDESTPGYPGPITLSPRTLVATRDAALRAESVQ
jgi:hypothetical protein